jgi:hypothetical protein
LTLSALQDPDHLGPPILPLTVGPIWLSSQKNIKAAKAHQPRPAPWSRDLSQLLGASDCGTNKKCIRLCELNAKDAPIAGSLWDAGCVLGAYLSHMWQTDKHKIGCRCQHGELEPKSFGEIPLCGAAIELGCGSGCAGLMLAAAMEASSSDCSPSSRPCAGPCIRDIILTDGNAIALQLARDNVTLNNLASRVTVTELMWEEAAALGADKPHLSLAGRYNLVFAADVVYDERKFLPLLETLYRCAWGASAGEGQPRMGIPAAVVLAYRLRMDEKSAQHFWHLLAERFDIVSQVPSDLLNSLVLSGGAEAEEGDAVVIYHLKPLLGGPRLTDCLYCARMLAKRRQEPAALDLQHSLLGHH